jgi:predicted CXXCH cytochrome family protein
LAPLRIASPGLEPEVCFPCHSRRQEIAAGHRAGQPFLDSYLPSLLEEPLYEATGHIKDEVFEYGSFVQSRMYRAGVTCSNCHDSHSLKLKARGNSLCLQCHKAQVFNTTQHHKHQDGSQAASCVTCHMPTRTYMGVHVRHDHAFSIPRPDWAAKYGTANTCAENCHHNQSTSTILNENVGPENSLVETMSALRNNQTGAFNMAVTFLGQAQQSAIARATVLPALASADSPSGVRAAFNIIEGASVDSDGLLRMGAARSLSGLPDAMKLRLGSALLTDPLRVVRIEAGRSMLGIDQGQLTLPLTLQIKHAQEELVTAEKLSSERPEALVNLAQIYRAMGNSAQAEQVLGQAQRIAPNFAPTLLILADMRREHGLEAAAEVLLRKALIVSPKDPAAQFALALGLIRQDRRTEAMPLLEQAWLMAPDNETYAYALGIALLEAKDVAQALQVAQSFLKRNPENVSLLKLHDIARQTQLKQ